MAFPQVAASATSETTVAGTNHSATLPASIAAGNLLIVAVSIIVVGAFDVNTPSGWTKDKTFTNDNRRIVILSKIAEGSEGASLAFTTTGSTTAGMAAYRITGHDSGMALAVSTGATASSTGADPDSLNPAGWATEDTLWIAAASKVATFTAAPTNYVNFVTNGAGTSRVALATREVNAASEDPGSFTNASNDRWVAVTVAVRPAAAAVGRSYAVIII